MSETIVTIPSSDNDSLGETGLARGYFVDAGLTCCASHTHPGQVELHIERDNQRFVYRMSPRECDHLIRLLQSSRTIAGGGTRTHTTLRSLGPKPSASANSATPATG